MSHSRRFAATMASLVALLAVPAGASAKVSSASHADSVATHVVKAQKAIKRMDRAAGAGSTAGVLRQLRTARAQTAAASREARAMAAGSDSVAAAQALTLAGTSYEQLIPIWLSLGFFTVWPAIVQKEVGLAESAPELSRRPAPLRRSPWKPAVVAAGCDVTQGIERC